MTTGMNSRRDQPVPHRSPTTRGSTKDAILDSAETLLGENDIAAVTMRSIADDAGVDPASITYHFGGKSDLLSAVFRRRYAALRERRMTALTRLLAESAEIPTAREILDTVFRPLFEVMDSGDAGWRSYSKLVVAMPDSPMLSDLIEDLSSHWEQALTVALRRAYPDASAELITQAFTMTLGAAHFVTRPPRLFLIGHDDPDDVQLRPSYPHFLRFVTSGFESMVTAPSA